MTTLLERARSAQALLEGHAAREAAEESARHFVKRTEELRETHDTLRQGALPAAVLRRAGRLKPAAVRTPDKITEGLITLRARARNAAPEKFAEGKDYAQWRMRVAKHSDTIAERAEEAWKAVKADFPPVETRLLEEIKQIPGQESAVALALVLSSKLRDTARPLPNSDTEFAGVLALAENLRNALEGLDDQHFPPKVRAFLRDVMHHQGADPASLTPEVRTWLDAQNMVPRIRLRWIVS